MSVKKILILAFILNVSIFSMEFNAATTDKITYTYYSNKAVKTKTVYNKEGKKIDYKRYDTKKRMIVDYNYRKNGSVYEIRTYYTNGKVKTFERRNGSKKIDYKRYNQAGKRIVDYNYRDDGKVYEVRTYYTNGKLKTFERRNGSKKTDYKKYNSKGILTTNYDYCTNGKVKKVKTYYTNGKVKTSKSYYCYDKTKLTVAQFNILKPDDNSYGSWNSRKAKIGKALNTANSDIVGLNEVYENYQITDIQNMTSYKVIKPVGSQPHGWTSAIAYNPKKVKLIKSGAYTFKNQETYTTGSLAGKKASRTAVWGLFEKNGIKFVFISGHTQNDWFTNVRYKQITELNTLGNNIASQNNVKNIIITGDFNAHGYSNPNCTKSQPTYIANGAKLGYDYICSNRKTNTSGTTINSGASDHTLVHTNTTISRK